MLTLRATAYEFGPYRLDPLGRSLVRGSELVALPPKAVEVLTVLINHAGAVIGKPELIEAVWPETIVEEANLNQMIFLLRRAFGEDSANGYIATVPRRGYRFTAGVRMTEIPCRIESIAVLPLANVSGDPAQEYFADGITEALITELAKIRSLRVVSRTSVRRYRGTKAPIAQIARALRAQALLEGSVMTSGDRFRITVQLIHAGADQNLWAQSYEGAASDILDVQARVARDVAEELRAELSQDERAHLTTLRTVHPQAYSLYLKGRYNARILTDELEPRWDQLYFGLGQTLVQQQRHEEAVAALRTAARMGPGNAFTEAALAYALGRAGRGSEAEHALAQLTQKYSYVPYWFYAIASIGLNDWQRAMDALDNAFHDHEPCLVSLKVDPVFDPLRQYDRFSNMVRRIGLEP